MKIAIYDIIHIEQVLPLLRVADYLQLTLVLFTHENFRADIEQSFPRKNNQVRIFYKAAHESEWGFMKNARDIVKNDQCRIFLLNSIDSKHLLWYWILSSLHEVVFVNTLHEINNLFAASFSMRPRKWIRQFGKKKFREMISAFTVNTPALQSNLLQRQLTNRKIWLLPQAIFDEKLIRYPSGDDEFRIVLPGTIDYRRRNYSFALDVYESILAAGKPAPQLYIAGPPMGEYGQAIISRAEKINLNGGKIRYSDAIIPEEEFDQIINNAHLIFSPQLLDTSISDGIPEIYGETKNSGNTHLALRFARPMLIPRGLKTALPDQKSILFYDDAGDCMNKISGLMQEPAMLNQLFEEAKKESRNFSVETVAEKFRELLNYYAEK